MFDKGEEGACYAVKFDDKALSEPQQFEEKIQEDEPESYEDIDFRLENMLDDHQFLPPMLELEEGNRNDWVVTIKTKEPKQLRWYGLRYSHKLLILGNGGVKKTQTYQEDSFLYQCVKDLQYVFRCIQKRMQRREIEFDNDRKRITGNLVFPVEQFRDVEYPEEG